MKKEIIKKINHPVYNDIEGMITRREKYLGTGYVYYVEIQNITNNKTKRKRALSCGCDYKSLLFGEKTSIDTLTFNNSGLEATLTTIYTGQIGAVERKSKKITIKKEHFPY